MANIKRSVEMDLAKARKLYQIDDPVLQEWLLNFFTTRELESPVNIVTLFPCIGESELRINKVWVGSIYHMEEQGHNYDGQKISGHNASIYLVSNHRGTWYDQKGQVLEGYLYYKSNK